MFKSSFKASIILLAIVPAFAVAKDKPSYSQPVFTDPERLAKIQKVLPSLDQLYSNYAEVSHIPGYCYGVVVDGKLIHSKCAGYADVANKIPVTAQTRFRLASVSKSFTAMAILKLRAAGKLNLDDPVSLYIPAMKGQKLTTDSPEITIRDLLMHASGLPQEDPWSDRKLDQTTEQFLNMLNNGLQFSNAVGIKFEYSSLSYTILGYVVTKVSGIPYQEYIAQNFWQPLQMHSATWEYSSIAAQNLAHGYKWQHDQWTEQAPLHDGVHAAMGGMWSSIEDLAKYVALQQSAWPPSNDPETGPISRADLRAMQQPWMFDKMNLAYKLMNGTNLPYTQAYGYGLFWMQDAQGKNYVYHPGSVPGFHAHWHMLPDYGVAVIVLGNVQAAPRFDVSMQALNTLVKEAKLSARVLPPSQLLIQAQAELMRVLPDWRDAEQNKIFADNLFQDFNLQDLQQLSKEMFAKSGKIVKIGPVIAENQLRGYFILEGEKKNLKIFFALTPEKPALIQQFSIESQDKLT